MKPFLLISLFISSFAFGQDQMYSICPIKNSENVPSAEVFDIGGSAIDLKNYIEKRPAVVVFFRGGWCPYCTRHLSALNEVKGTIDSLGFELIAITPDDYTQLDSSIKRSGGLDYKLFSDKNLNAINSFGIGWNVDQKLYDKYKNSYKLDLEWWNKTENHVLPVPSVFIIKDEEIQFQHVNPDYSKRLSPEILMGFLSALAE